MKNIKYFFGLFALLLVFTSCEDVIQLDLEEKESQLVIEANLNTTNQSAEVSISNSNGFYDDTNFEREDEAIITLTTPSEIYILEAQGNGKYTVQGVSTNPEELIEIEIELEGKVYTTSSMVPHPVPLIALNSVEFEFPFGLGSDSGEQTFQISASWVDPLESNDYYRFRSFIDDEYQSQLYDLGNDKGREGTEINVPVRMPFEKNDNVRIELLSTSQSYFDYFFEISSQQSQGFNSGNPFNPKGNFNEENVLGYFGIYTVSSKEIQL